MTALKGVSVSALALLLFLRGCSTVRADTVGVYDFQISMGGSITSEGFFSIGTPYSYSCSVGSGAVGPAYPITDLFGVFDGSRMQLSDPAPASCTEAEAIATLAPVAGGHINPEGIFLLDSWLPIQFTTDTGSGILGYSSMAEDFGIDRAYYLSYTSSNERLSLFDGSPADQTLVVEVTGDVARTAALDPPIDTPEPSVFWLFFGGALLLLIRWFVILKGGSNGTWRQGQGSYRCTRG